MASLVGKVLSIALRVSSEGGRGRFMQSERRVLAGEETKSRKRLGISWTAVFTLLLGLIVN
ncbi:MAG: hypothetical protein WAN13_19760, partial [Candidatus Acidiferrales bacterium]